MLLAIPSGCKEFKQIIFILDLKSNVDSFIMLVNDRTEVVPFKIDVVALYHNNSYVEFSKRYICL